MIKILSCLSLPDHLPQRPEETLQQLASASLLHHRRLSPPMSPIPVSCSLSSPPGQCHPAPAQETLPSQVSASYPPQTQSRLAFPLVHPHFPAQVRGQWLASSSLLHHLDPHWHLFVVGTPS